MPIDAAIPLSVKTPETPNLIQGLSAISQLKSQQLTQQLQAQEIQKQTAEAAIQQQNIAGVKALNAAVQASVDPATGQPDYEKAAQITEKGGFVAQAQSLREIAVSTAKSHNELQTQKLTYGAAQAKAIADTLATVKDSKDPNSAYQASLALLQSKGIDISKMSPTYNPDQVQTWVDAGYGHEEQLKQKLTAAQTGEATAKTTEANANASKTTQMLPGQLANQGLTNTKLTQDTTGTTPITPEQKQTNKIAQQQANAASANATTNRNKANVELNRFKAEYGTDKIGGYADQVEKNPDVLQTIPANAKMLVGAELIKRGKNIPVPLAADMKNQESNSVVALSHIDNMNKLLSDPDVQNSIGPIMGRLAKGESSLGTSISKNPRVAEKQQQLLTSMEYLFIKEAKSLMGGRPPVQMMKKLQEVSVNPAMSRDFLKGSLSAAQTSAQRTIATAQALRFGSGNAAAQVGTPSGAGGKTKKVYNPTTGEIEDKPVQ